MVTEISKIVALGWVIVTGWLAQGKFWCDEDILYLDREMDYMGVYVFIKHYWIIILKFYVSYISISKKDVKFQKNELKKDA